MKSIIFILAIIIAFNVIGIMEDRGERFEAKEMLFVGLLFVIFAIALWG